ncbi:hypothetical protein F5144DRAFT_626551 [Chaetomium tenue]|uniref:Uncharacterized protein n=1 Tax=Chaetomium tenue TaxID=1854479 RepID=A0ACB7PJY0_9PEZI|nr:hypothetical protein F5144DRAFT_626551 [Chaetomium globosum]
MVALLIAPYNDAMTLGQGYNSFLQVPCIDGAVEIPENSLKTQAVRAGGVGNVSQVVSYSSRFVEKISDVVRSMNISAASSIKSGTIEASGNSLSVDEAKFAASDLNAVVSVKVINQTTSMIKQPKFKPMNNVKMTSEKFFDYYGDCYISDIARFMEGGDLHGIVSIKVLDASKKTQVEAALKGAMNGSTNNEFTLSEGSSMTDLNASLSETETTVTVSWSGGGQIKPDNEEWNLESLVKAASGFPTRVASCPQRTWAILTKYDNNRSFLEWADRYDIRVPQFEKATQIASDFLDDFMEYKNNLVRLQAVMASPRSFMKSPYKNPVGLGVEALVAERKSLKAAMSRITRVIDQLNSDPSYTPTVDIESPEVWAARLPIRKDSEFGSSLSSSSDNNAAALLAGFSFVNDVIAPVKPTPAETTAPPAPATDALKTAMDQLDHVVTSKAEDLAFKAPPPSASPSSAAPICANGIVPHLSAAEQAFVNLEANKQRYAAFRFDRATGHDGGGAFNDAVTLVERSGETLWPKTIEIQMVQWSTQRIVRRVEVDYYQLQTEHGSVGTVADSLTIYLAPEERINRMRLGRGDEIWDVEGVAYVEVWTTAGQNLRIGDPTGREVIDYYPYDGCVGLKAFWGCQGDVIDKLAPIWGK